MSQSKTLGNSYVSINPCFVQLKKLTPFERSKKNCRQSESGVESSEACTNIGKKKGVRTKTGVRVSGKGKDAIGTLVLKNNRLVNRQIAALDL